ncbi:MAG: choice-of-anchor I family protein [Chloroflexota bacterium]|nr:choice-of-anchor I family protein [Chloroflexota bacterium]
MLQTRLSILLAIFAVALAIGPAAAQENALILEPLGTYATGAFDEAGAEEAVYDAASQRLFVVNGADNTIDILDISDPTAPMMVTQVELSEYGDGVNNVAIQGGLIAAAVEAEAQDGAGAVVFMDAEGTVLGSVEVGVQPDHVVFTPDGAKAVTANEGEPSDDYAVDPEGSISIIDLSGGVEVATVNTLTFTDFNEGGARAAELAAEVRIYGPGATVAQDIEPEFAAITPDGAVALVTLQENNAIAVVDLAAETIVEIRPLGFKDHLLEGNGIDASNEDGAINIANWPVLGMYQPDGIATFTVGDVTYAITANEGDTRDYEGFSEEAEVSELTLDETAFPDAANLQLEANLGKLEVTNTMGDTDGDGDFDTLYLPGGRSFSIWSLDGSLIYDSGDDFEQVTSELLPEEFNATNDENGSFDDRSDNKGPEPEEVAVGMVGESLYAFIGFERIGGIIVYDISDPAAPVFVTYVNNRDFTGDPTAGTAGDLGPEGVKFISADESPTGTPLLIVANEISGTLTIFQITSGM